LAKEVTEIIIRLMAQVSCSLVDTGAFLAGLHEACLHDQSKNDYFGEPAFSGNQSFLKTFQTALIGWIKAGPPKTTFVLIM